MSDPRAPVTEAEIRERMGLDREASGVGLVMLCCASILVGCAMVAVGLFGLESLLR